MNPIATLKKLKDTNKALIFIAAVVGLSRLPFLTPGYGNDPDAWRVANAARTILDTSSYVYSRPPGFPLHEIISAFLIPGGPWLMNGASMIMSVAAVVFFILSLRLMKVRNAELAGLALAFTPIVYVAGTITMDYIWALAFIMLSLYLFLKGRLIWSGIALGAAVGCRITSGAMVLPFLIILSLTWRKVSLRTVFIQLMCYLIPVLATSAILYLPVYMKYGKAFFTFYDVSGTPMVDVLSKLTFGVWGYFGAVALGLILVAAAFFPGAVVTDDQHDRSWRRFLRPSIVAIVLYVVAFLRLPCEPSYLIPLVPFAILILAGSLHRRVMIAICVILAFTCFFDLKESGASMQISQGQILSLRDKRIRSDRFVHNLIEQGESLPGKAAVCIAWWEPYVRMLRRNDDNDSLKFIYYLDQNQVDILSAEGYRFYHLPEVEKYNLDNQHFDLTEVSTPLHVIF
ncbi:MAG TPA: hypothetical protein PLF13_03525 [candidate division Zixibacteria bacterium]|nr:hypothetical protein [candidate division Zixibacteria bacterium]